RSILRRCPHTHPSSHHTSPPHPPHSTSSPLMLPPPPRSTLFPYTTLFRSATAAPTPGSTCSPRPGPHSAAEKTLFGSGVRTRPRDRKSTRLNSSHVKISYAVFCLKKKKE